MFCKKHVLAFGFSLFLNSLLLLSASLVLADENMSVSETGTPNSTLTIWIDTVTAYFQTNAVVSVYISDAIPISRFDLFFSYDARAIHFVDAEPIGVVADWEYFTYRTHRPDSCDGECQTNYIRLRGIADLPDGEDPGDVYLPDGGIVQLKFRTTTDCWFSNSCFYLEWVWTDCLDNTITSVNGNTIFAASDLDEILAEEQCLERTEPGEFVPAISFGNGLICTFSFCERGDINLNGIVYEIGDATLFSNYFIYGPAVWDPIYYENQILASDINDDGQVLTVADLVTLMCMIANSGNAWYPPCGGYLSKQNATKNTAYLDYSLDEELVVSAESPVDIGAAAFIFEHNGLELGAPILAEENGQMMIGSSDNNGTLRVLVFSMDGHSLAAGEFGLFTVPASGAGTIELIEVQFSDAYGNMMEVITEKLAPPVGFELLQNYPNPFNAATTIHFALPVASDWTLDIYNIIGRKIEGFSDHSAAGRVAVEWDATDDASGMYFYKLATGKFTATRKMVLMK